jgi:hypothetical protein
MLRGVDFAGVTALIRQFQSTDRKSGIQGTTHLKAEVGYSAVLLKQNHS